MYFLNITDIAEQDILSAIKYITDVLKMPTTAINLPDLYLKQRKTGQHFAIRHKHF